MSEFEAFKQKVETIEALTGKPIDLDWLLAQLHQEEHQE